jgi:gas vesicle protein
MTSDRGVLFLAGVGIGIAGAVLFAPYKGKETRRRLQQGANDTLDQVTDVLRQGESNIGDLKNRAKNKLDDVAGTAMKTADQAIDKSRDAAHSAGKKMEEVGKRLQQA